MKQSFIDMFSGSLALALTRRCGAFIVAALEAVFSIGKVSHVLGAASLPVEPGDGLAPSLAVARALKPTESVGGIVLGLLSNKNTSEDRLVVVHKPGGSILSRVLMFPYTADPGEIFQPGEVAIATITRDDVTKDTSSHSAAFIGGGAATPEGIALAAVLAYPAPGAGEKPKRNLASLINALLDAFDAIDEPEGYAEGIGLVFNQAANGTLVVYTADGIDDTAGKVGDVAQVEPEATTANPIW